MGTTEKIIDVLNDLIRVNKDRISNYENAIKELSSNDVDLNTLFKRLASDSCRYIDEISEHIENLGGKVAYDSTNTGIIYHTWMSLKATFTGHDKYSILTSCEFGEDAAQSAYYRALMSDANLSGEIGLLVSRQKTHLRAARDEIKKMRNMIKA